MGCWYGNYCIQEVIAFIFSASLILPTLKLSMMWTTLSKSSFLATLFLVIYVGERVWWLLRSVWTELQLWNWGLVSFFFRIPPKQSKAKQPPHFMQLNPTQPTEETDTKQPYVTESNHNATYFTSFHTFACRGIPASYAFSYNLLEEKSF